MNGKEIAEEDVAKKLKEHLKACPGISSESPAMKAAMKALDKEGARDPLPRRRSGRFLNVFGHILRTVILDFPLMLLFAAYVSTIILEEVHVQYIMPQVVQMKWGKKRQKEELTYYSRDCSRDDITTNSTKDLLLAKDTKPIACMEHMLHHGVSIYSDILSNETAKAARNYILERNVIEKSFHVIENDNRYSFGIKVNSHPSIQQALKEIGQHEQLQAALRKIVGPNPAIVEFTGITATFGAADQFYHQDVISKGSAFKFARSFVPTYSLFIPLQDITPEMGPTEICPGTHQCMSGITGVCENGSGLLVSGKNDTWKSGYGALLNQQMFHRGTAHVDKGGPARTLFILTFASRPRYGKNQLETRMIGQEGSYSLKWNQWGHTMEDFTNPSKYMSEPWVTLRSLGIFKPPGRDWGWDYISVACMRIANADNGFRQGSLKEFVKKGGFDWLPDFLKPKLQKGDNWKYYIMRLIETVQEWLKKVNMQVMAGYLALLFVLNLFLWLAGFKGRRGALLRSLGRLIVTHGLVLLLTFMVARRINTSQWAENIRLGKAGKSYRSPIATSEKATLPFDSDVLKDTRYQTPYLASYTRMFDVNHPGNQNWRHLIHENCLDYNHLPNSLKRGVVNMVISEMKAGYSGRLLRQNDEARWVVMSDQQAQWHTHMDLSKANNEALGYAVAQLDFLHGELPVGVFRDTKLHREHIPALLNHLREKLVGILPDESLGSTGHLRAAAIKQTNETSRFRPRWNLKKPGLGSISRAVLTPHTMLPPKPKPSPPYKGAWVQEGDKVVGMFKGKHNGMAGFSRRVDRNRSCEEFSLVPSSL